MDGIFSWNSYYSWEEQSKGFYELPSKVQFCKDNDLWQPVRKLYMQKKNYYIDPSKKSRSIFAETIHEICQGGQFMRNFSSKDDVLTLLVHVGYLAYDSETREVFIPNKEIIEEFETAMRVSGWPEVMRVLKASDRLLADTLNCDSESVADALDKAHSEVSPILTYNDENSLSCAIGLAYYSARKDYKFIRELSTGKGFADIVFLPLPHTKSPAIVVELKYDKTADTAIQQIKERRYTQASEGYSGEILLVGISYKKENKDKPHSCVIEKLNKPDDSDKY